MFKLFNLLLIVLLFSGCMERTQKLEQKKDELLERKARIEARLQKAREEADKQKELALTKMQQEIEKLALQRSKNEAQKEVEIAKIKAKQALELQKIEQTYKLKELELKKQKELLELQNQKIIAQKELELKKQFLLFSLIALVIILVVVLIVLYFYKKRKDKLIAYHDNLEKYFRLKENEAKVAIANKIIDTIAEGKLTPEQEQRLLGVLKGETKELPKEIENKKEEPIEAEVEEKKDG
ncbi:hypothetical protein [Nitratiruptor sp. SB155-2]|uniref:hypothetical protein n=1 Tax=Nitratiruptor sp. (strain SB155-2) TaxID=387092 RepID=UPI00015873CC|nr:hypothetical protein [Nitratiruptor sp. SB155-2]BAF70771.1 hypothetical protein NIS_1665 [Nitratiruptor sp. SB155-2]